MAVVSILCPPYMGITQQSIRQAAIQAGYKTDAEIIEYGAKAVQNLSRELKKILESDEIPIKPKRNEVSA